MPVRVKQRALESETGREDEKQLEALRKHLVGLLLAWHIPILFTLKSVESNKKLSIRGKECLLGKKEDLEASPRIFDLPLVCSILSQATYIETSDWNTWVKASARTPSISIRGAISLRPAPSKRVQFISLGIYHANVEASSNILYDEVNRLFASSSFGNEEDISATEENFQTKRSNDRRFKQDGFTNKQLKGGGKGVDRWPMFYIRIETQDTNLGHREDVTTREEGSLSKVLKVLGAMIAGFLEENHYRPRARLKSLKQTAPRKRMALGNCPNFHDLDQIIHVPKATHDRHQDYDFSTWSRIKSGIRVKSSASSPAFSLNCQVTSAKSEASASIVPGVESNVPSQAPKSSDLETVNRTVDHDLEQTLEWRNPVSKAKILINARTGLVVGPQLAKRPATAPSRLLSSVQATECPVVISSSAKRLTRGVSTAFVTPQEGSWSSDLLKNWENPVFDTTEQGIPQISFDGPNLETSMILHGQRHFCSNLDIQKAFKQSFSSSSAKLSKSALKRAKIIAQVCKKFILVIMNDASASDDSTRPRLLVLVDQHAADERVRVEELLADLISSPIMLVKPIIFEIQAREHGLLARYADYFASWGIVYDLSAAAGSPQCRVNVRSLPVAIAERCRVEPKVLVELLRSEAWKCEEFGSRPQTQSKLPGLSPPTASKHENWLGRLGDCPRGLLDMLNSRACRSAIMFNDELSREECQTLVEKLAECAFPFQCAHGRPSMIPLVGLGTNTSFDGGEMPFGTNVEGTSSKEEGFGHTWKKWKPVPPIL